MTDLLQRVENQIQSRRLLKRGEKILVAVSAGLDSMVLLHALNEISARKKLKIVIAHFNHQLRGRASDSDEKHARKMAAQLKLPIVVESADVKQFATKSRLSIEMAARKLRHEFFARVARRQKIKTIALAHHADDQVELFFLRLLRGAGGEGLSGMKWKSPSPADKSISLIRPLLDFSKSELQEFARESKIQFRHDTTNFSLDFLRNRIRNELLPLLRKKYQPGLNKTVLRLMEIIGAESDFTGSVASSLRLDSVQTRAEHFAFNNLPVAIQRKVLQSQLAEQNVPVDFNLIERLRQVANQFVSISQNLSVSRNNSGVIELCAESKLEFKAGERFVNLKTRNRAEFSGALFNWQFDAKNFFGWKKNKIALEYFDADKIGIEIFLRHWRAGDRFQPIGLKSAVKLQDLFTNAKIPQPQRRDLIVAETANGEIFWVEGLRISENFKIMPQTKRQLIWRWKNAG